ncbi:MAG: TSUP family transporter [Cyclobacteriaceae bacterium]|nr:TSUP family transporter [Cyclobacteriaceae bacterium]
MDYWIYLLICFGAAFAGFIDAVVGGGGLVQVPLLFVLFPELLHVQVIATNRFASIAGTTVAAVQYIRHIGIDTAVVLITGISAGLCSFGGTFAMGLVSSEIFKTMLLFIIVVLAIYTFVRKDLGIEHAPSYDGKKLWLMSALIGAALGFYNGFIGPGTGTLLVFAFVTILQVGFLQGSTSAKIVNAMADFASLIGFFISGSIVYKIAVPMMAANMLGGYIGSKAAILKGNRFIRYIFLFVLALLIARMSWDLFGKS